MNGSQKSGDAFVAATLEAVVADPAVLAGASGPRVALYRNFSRLLSSVAHNVHPAPIEPPHAPLRSAERHLAAITTLARQVFLLTAVEGFTTIEVAEILDVSQKDASSLRDHSGREIAQQAATNVVIVEDEPLIAMELESLVQELGHRVSRVARTRRQAVAAISSQRPGFVLADIQLADGSSGLDAVKDVLGSFDVPVIFVTAYPEQLLTDGRPEPTFLVTKPFQSETLKAVMSQALFFDAMARLAPQEACS